MLLVCLAACAGTLAHAAPDSPDAADTPQAVDPAAPPAAPAETAKPRPDEHGHEPHRAKPPASKPGSLEPVEVEGRTLGDIEQRRASTAAKMVFGREELDRYGDSSIGEVLKRLPGITISGRPGRGGDIRMRGLGHGYTQILINGDPAPRGFSLDSLSPEQVERIEIYRAPVAEHSARAIAGTVNIVLREELRQDQTEVRLSGTEEKGHLQPGASIQRSDNSHDFGYNLALNVFGRDQGSEVFTTTTGTTPPGGAVSLLQHQFDDSRTTGEGIHLTSRLSWHLEGGDVLNLTPFLMESRSPTHGFSELQQSIGATPPPFDLAQSTSEADTTIARAGGDWQHKLESGSRLKLRFLFSQADNDTSTQESEAGSGGVAGHQIFSATQIHDHMFSNGGKLTMPIKTGGEVSSGWDLEYTDRVEGATSVQDGQVQLAQFGSQVDASVLRAAGFAQRDWDIDPGWSAYAGLRWEGISTRSSDSAIDVDNGSSVWSPMLQSLWKLGDEKQERPTQVRLSLARTYRAPNLNNLVARPTLSTLYPVSGSNAPNSPDQVGNPQLRPEIAWGLDVALEQYLPQGGILSASAFHRSIEDLMRSSIQLEPVPWSSFPRWVSEPQNVGRAQASGVELEAKCRLAEMLEDAPAVDLHVNYSRFWSTVSQIVGPDNRLDQQPRQTANLGLDEHLASAPLTLGFNYNWTPAFLVRQSDTQLYSQGLKRVLDGYLVWTINPATRLRISVSNALHRDYETGNTVFTETFSEDADAVARTYVAWAARLEIKL